MVQLKEFLELSDTEFEAFRKEMSSKQEVEEFVKLKPEFVINHVDQMISDLVQSNDIRNNIFIEG